MGCVCVCVMEEGESEFVHMSWHLLSVYSLETLLIIMSMIMRNEVHFTDGKIKL